VNEGRRQTPIPGNVANEEDRKRPKAGQVYQIRIKGHLDDRWSEWLEGLRITHEEDGSTVLTGQVADQPALHGLLIKIRDLGAPLVSVNVLGSGDMDHTERNRKEPHRRAGEDGWLD
jgi:hypothetical protein